MDFLSLFLCFIVSPSTVVLSFESSSSSKCRQCRPGYYASRLCTDTHDTICAPCSEGAFTSVENSFQKCSKCSKCKVGEFISVPCLPHSDTICESCSAASDITKDSFSRDCVQNDRPYELKDLNKETHSSEKYRVKERTFLFENNALYEGSGALDTQVNETVYDTSDQSSEAVEGSGEIHFDGNQSSTVHIPIIPDESEDKLDEIITTVAETNVSRTLQPTTKLPQTSTSETITADGVITIGDGIILKNETEKQFETDVIITKAPVISTSVIREATTASIRSTTIRTIVIKPEEGITIPTETTTRRKGHRKEDDGIIVNQDPLEPRDQPQFEASKTEDSRKEPSGVSVGVFVAVCIVCAAIFFVLGLMVNKYWAKRRSRSFNVEQAEKQNGKTIPDSRIEFKDPEKNLTTKTGIYDEIPVDKQNGKESLSKDPVYSKPVKRRENNPVNKANPEPGVGASDNPKAPSSDAPGNEARYSRPYSASIKYIDDEQTDEERETDKLLPQTNQKENLASGENNGSPNSSEEKHEGSFDDTEVTPMIVKDNDTINV